MIKATYFLCLITFLVFMVDTFSYTLRLIIFRNKSYNVTNSTFNIMSMVVKLALTFQAPLLGILIDVSIAGGRDPLNDFRLIILSSTVGVSIAIILLPTFIKLFNALVSRVTNKGSYSAMAIDTLKSINQVPIKSLIVLPKKSMLKELKLLKKHKWILLFNLVVASVYTIGILSAYYASISVPSHRLSIAGFSGSINSIASIVLLVFLEPRLALITDQVYRGDEDYSNLKIVVLALVLSKLLGTIIAQALFVPASKWILFVFELLT